MPDATPQPMRPTNSAIDAAKETLESIVVAFILAFAFRAYVVEAFVIPTGSMAPTLLGAHYDVRCSQCGWDFTVDTPDYDKSSNRPPPPLPYDVRATCTQCQFPNFLPKGLKASPGDRILVQKYLYRLKDPQRWDVVVFKNPENPSINFIKRLIGLPGESLLIIDGDIYVRPSGETRWHIARKTVRPEVQNAVWQPVYHSTYIPLDNGESLARGDVVWHVPWRAQEPAHWQIKNRRSYLFDGQGNGRIDFAFEEAVPETRFAYVYNQLKSTYTAPIPIQDVRVATAIRAEETGLGATLSTTTRLDDTEVLHRVSAVILPDGAAQLTASALPDGPVQVLATTHVGVIPTNRALPVELHVVDQEISMWVDGVRALTVPIELSIEQVALRPPPPMFPKISIELTGAAAELHRVEVDRDLHYWSMNEGGVPARGALDMAAAAFGNRTLEEQIDNDALHLPDASYFCMGDNSPKSHDGRFWDRVDPWVQRMLDPDETGESTPGIVPQQLMMGRAFFVYFPSPLRWDPHGKGLPVSGLIPNFGQMRMID